METAEDKAYDTKEVTAEAGRETQKKLQRAKKKKYRKTLQEPMRQFLVAREKNWRKERRLKKTANSAVGE